MRRKQQRLKPSFLIQPDIRIDKKYENLSRQEIDDEIAKCSNGFEGLKYFINEYLYVQNKIKPEILVEKPTWFKHILFEGDKINLKLYPKQEEYLETLQNNRLTASFKSRQCLPSGSIIYTPSGPVEIQDLKQNDVVYSFNEISGEIEADIVVDAWKSGIRQCTVMTTIDGNRTIQGENHPFLLENGEQKKCIELQKGDILVNNNGYFGEIDVPDYISKLLAWFITDGRTVKQPSFTNTNQNYIIDVSTCLTQFDPNLIITIRERDKSNIDQLDSWDVYPHTEYPTNKKNSFHQFLIEMGIYGHTGNTKILPDVVFEWNKKSISILLNRIFAGDGQFTKSISTKRNNGCEVGLGSPCKQFIYQIKQLLWNFNIECKIKKSFEKGGTGNLFYRLIISHRENIKKFYDEIGIFGKPFDYEYKHNTKAELKRLVTNKVNNEIECWDIETFKNKNFIFEGRVVHNTGITTITQAYILWYAIFNENKEIDIVSKTESDAIKFLATVYYMFNHLPFFLRRQYSKAVKKSFHIGSLNKATKIEVLTSTGKSGRSFSATILILDEVEFIEHVDELWAAAQPTLSATGGQGIVISTPWLYKSWFWKICHNESGDAFKLFKINWSDIPGRDKDWYEQQCAELNHDRLKIMTELDMQWIIPYQKFYQEDFLKVKYIKNKNEFLRYESDYNFGIIREPEEDNEYYFGVDTYEGGKDFNAGTIVDREMRICAYFKTQRLDIFELVKFLCDYYHTKVNIERNRGFWLIKEFMDKELHRKYVLFKLVKRKNIFDEQYGYIINGENRKKLIGTTSEYLKYIFNVNHDATRETIWLPEDLVDEMTYFVIKKSKTEGLENDDLIFALIASLYVRDNKISFYNWKSTNKNRTGTMDLVSKFYEAQKEKNNNNIFINGTVNTLLASNVLSSFRSGKKMTEKELDMLEQVLAVGKTIAEEKFKAKEHAHV